MRWCTVPIRKVAPPIPAKVRFDSNESIWHLSLDQIESETGLITGKKYAPLKDAGSSTFCFDTANVLYSKLRSYLNKVIIPDEPGIATTELIPLRPNTKIIHPKFLTYYLRSKSFVNQASHHVAGAKMPRVVMDWFWEHEIPLPCLIEQNHIVEILDEADRLRRLRREADAKAARILPALFLKMFGDPATNPKRWPIANLETISEIISGATKGRQLNGVETVELPYMRVANVKDGYLDLSSIKTITVRIDEVDKYRLRSGDLLMTEGGDPDKLGRTAIWSGEIETCLHQNHIFKVRVRREIVLPEYLHELIGSSYGKAYFLGVAKKTTGIATINRTQLGRFPVLIPPMSLQVQFVTKFSQLRLLESHQASAAKAIESLFSQLLQRAFSGQLTAKWREVHSKELLAEMEQQAQLLNLPLPKELELAP